MSLTDLLPSVEVTAPAVAPYPFGLFSAVASDTPADAHWQAGVWWRSLACNLVGVTEGLCTVDDAVPELTPNVVCGTAHAHAFTVYAHSDESMGGASLPAKFQAARDLLAAGEQYAVESALWTALVAAVAAPDGTGGTVAEAVAMAEGLIATYYGGTPVLHMSRYTATMAGMDVLRVDGSRLRTTLGSGVVAGGGYLPAPVATAPNDVAVFATGGLVLLRGEIIDLGTTYDTRLNNISAVVERTYIVGWDCTAVRVGVSAPPA